MTDFDLCNNKGCPSRKHCARATAKPSGYDYYGYFKVPEGHEYCFAYKKESNAK